MSPYHAECFRTPATMRTLSPYRIRQRYRPARPMRAGCPRSQPAAAVHGARLNGLGISRKFTEAAALSLHRLLPIDEGKLGKEPEGNSGSTTRCREDWRWGWQMKSPGGS